MSYVQPKTNKEITYKAISENDIDKVIFSDPFTDVTRKSKRNLLVASLISILISTLHLEINGFLGLKATSAPIGNEVAQGISFFIVLYFFLSFIFQAFIDYIAWDFNQEKCLIKPYLQLAGIVESQINTAGQQLKNATYKINDIQGKTQDISVINSCKQQLDSINKNLSSAINDINPFLKLWAKQLNKRERLSIRLNVRFLSLWALDIVFPLVVSAVALYKCYGGVTSVFL